MRKKILTIVILIICLGKAQSQGFDWQYSARLPFEVPNFFIGLDVTGGYKFNNSNFKICDNNIPCDTFKLGNGIDLSAGIKLEYWASSDIAYFTNVNLVYSQHSYKNENLYYYFSEVGTKTLEYEYLRTEYIPEIEIGAKYRMRFLLPHLFGAFSIKTGVVASTTEELILRKISKADWLANEIHFTGFAPLDLSAFIVEPHLKLGYDANLGLGSFASLYIDIGFPLQNRYSEGSWHSTNISAGISVFPIGF
jgi:hypothetical protein